MGLRGEAAIVGIAGCASVPGSAELDRQALAMMKASFRDQGIAKTDRLNQDKMQAACSSDKPPSKAVEDQIMAEARASVKFPAGGRFFGDWRAGEKLAQSGRGLQYSDDGKSPNGGNCYACHQIQKAEISFGNIGPSLTQYGKLRGNSEPIVKYTWAKIFNSHSYNACSNMPRYGAAEILTEKQIKDVMALLLDPQSPVNK